MSHVSGDIRSISGDLKITNTEKQQLVQAGEITALPTTGINILTQNKKGQTAYHIALQEIMIVCSMFLLHT